MGEFFDSVEAPLTDTEKETEAAGIQVSRIGISRDQDLDRAENGGLQDSRCTCIRLHSRVETGLLYSA